MHSQLEDKAVGFFLRYQFLWLAVESAREVLALSSLLCKGGAPPLAPEEGRFRTWL